MIPTKECCSSRFRTRDLLKLSEKKTACKINENDLKIAWNALSGNPVLKISRGRPPDPLIRGEPFSYSPPLAAYAARYMPSAVNAPPVFRPSGSSPAINIATGPRGVGVEVRGGGGGGGEGNFLYIV